MKITVAAVQMRSELLDVPANLQRADELLRSAHDSGVELAVLPELFNTGYSLCPDFGPYSETAEGPTLAHLRLRSQQWQMAIMAGFVEREGRHLYDSLAFCAPTATCRSTVSGILSSGNVFDFTLGGRRSLCRHRGAGWAWPSVPT